MGEADGFDINSLFHEISAVGDERNRKRREVIENKFLPVVHQIPELVAHIPNIGDVPPRQLAETIFLERRKKSPEQDLLEFAYDWPEDQQFALVKAIVVDSIQPDLSFKEHNAFVNLYEPLRSLSLSYSHVHELFNDLLDGCSNLDHVMQLGMIFNSKEILRRIDAPRRSIVIKKYLDTLKEYLKEEPESNSVHKFTTYIDNNLLNSIFYVGDKDQPLVRNPQDRGELMERVYSIATYSLQRQAPYSDSLGKGMAQFSELVEGWFSFKAELTDKELEYAPFVAQLPPEYQQKWYERYKAIRDPFEYLEQGNIKQIRRIMIEWQEIGTDTDEEDDIAHYEEFRDLDILSQEKYFIFGRVALAMLRILPNLPISDEDKVREITEVIHRYGVDTSTLLNIYRGVHELPNLRYMIPSQQGNTYLDYLHATIVEALNSAEVTDRSSIVVDTIRNILSDKSNPFSSGMSTINGQLLKHIQDLV